MGYIRVFLGDALKDQIALDKDRFTIGRAPDNDLVLNDSGVSGRHAIIVHEDGRFFIEDNDSTNGVFLNKQRITRAELSYWDEIQIFRYVLKFMALSRHGTIEDPDAPDSEIVTGADKTRVVDIPDGERLAKLRNTKKSAYVVLHGKDGREERIPFQKVSLVIGRARNADIRTGGWLAPRRAAELVRGADGYHLIPRPRGKVTINGVKVAQRSQVKDGDAIEVRGLRLGFFHRVVDDQ